MNLKNNVITVLDAVVKNYKSFNKINYYKLGTLSFKSHAKSYSAYLATHQLMVTIWGLSDPYFPGIFT